MPEVLAPISEAISENIRRLSLEATKTMAESPASNAVISGSGIWTAFMVVLGGAKGTTADQLTQLLGFSSEEAAAAVNELEQHLARVGGLAHSTALWARVSIWKEFQDKFSSVMFGALDNQQSLDDWANEATGGLISQFPVRVSKETLAILADAISARARWSKEFGALDIGHVEGFYQSLVDAGLGARSIDHYHRVLTNALRWASSRKWINHIATTGATKPKTAKPELTIPTPVEVRALMDTAQRHSKEGGILIQLAVDTWCRPAEILGMRWDKIDLNAGTIVVDGAIDSSDRKGNRKDTKTHSKRLLSVGSQTIDALHEYRAWMENNAKCLQVPLSEEAYLLSMDGVGLKPWHPSKSSGVFRVIALNAGVKGVRLYDLRHFGATQALGAGLPITQVSYRLGHNRISTTYDHYSHHIPERDRDVATFMGELMRPQPAIETAKPPEP